MLPYYYDTFTTALGALAIAVSDKGLQRISFGADEPRALAELQSHYTHEALQPNAAACAHVREQIHAYLAGDITHFNLSLDIKGTPFQQAIWHELSQMEYGETSTYSALAQNVAKPLAIRAAGSACGMNPVPLVIPCHRILAKNGSLGGFAWGLKVKEQLLALEKRALQSFAEADLTAIAA